VQIRGASLHWYKRFDTETTIMSWEDIFCKWGKGLHLR
jgi:hypothetical protein